MNLLMLLPAALMLVEGSKKIFQVIGARIKGVVCEGLIRRHRRLR